MGFTSARLAEYNAPRKEWNKLLGHNNNNRVRINVIIII
jgi:hypothetical protein